MLNVLWVGDGDKVPESFEREGVSVRVAGDPEEALGYVKETDCVVGESSSEYVGPSFFSEVRELSPDVPCVVYGDIGGWEKRDEEDVVVDFVPSEAGGEALLRHVRIAYEERTQVSYPLRDDEEERLEEAVGYADAAPEGAFDRLTRLAQMHFGTELAFVGIVEKNRERFLSCHGADIDQLPREKTVCTFQILDDGVSVFEDVLEDSRFKLDEAVQSMGLRFYAGAPLMTESGFPIGSFCVMDTEKRRFDDDDRRFLRTIADEAAEKLGLLRERKETGRASEKVEETDV